MTDNITELIYQQMIQQSLQLHLYQEALFHSERLYAEYPHNPSNLQMVALCYFRMNKVSQAFHIFHGMKSKDWMKDIQCLYLFSCITIELQYWYEAEKALDQILKLLKQSSSALPAQPTPKSSNPTQTPITQDALYYRLGYVYEMTNRIEKAKTYYLRSVKLNPLMWSAIERLTQLGVPLLSQYADFFKYEHYAQQCIQRETCTPRIVHSNIMRSTNTDNEFKRKMGRLSVSSTTSSLQPKNLSFDTPSPKSGVSQTSVRSKTSISPIERNMVSPSFSTPSTTNDQHSDGEFITPSPKMIVEGPPPLKQQDKPKFKSPQSNLFTTEKGLFQTPVKKDDIEQIPDLNPNNENQQLAITQILKLFQCIGEAYQLFGAYKCQESINKFRQLSQQQYSSGWVLCKIARCYFEMEMYEKAEREFNRVKNLEPYRLEDLEYFSTVLWHLKKERELSYLAQRMSVIDKHSPHTLIALGNCFSLNKDHETALKFFERATKVDNLFAYAFTLAGHEHLENDDTEEAMKSYREALRINSRHYNAWYGLGTVYQRQEKFQKAEQHYRFALRIKPKSSVMCCYLGMSLKDGKRLKDALSLFNHALKIQPKNPMTKFKRAEVLYELGQYAEARDELESLKQIVPKEPFLYSTLGDVYVKIGDESSLKQAGMHYQHALQLGHKDSSSLRTKISKLFDQDDSLEDEEP